MMGILRFGLVGAQFPGLHGVIITAIFRVSDSSFIVDMTIKLHTVPDGQDLRHELVVVHITIADNHFVHQQDRLLLPPVVSEGDDGLAGVNDLFDVSRYAEDVATCVA